MTEPQVIEAEIVPGEKPIPPLTDMYLARYAFRSSLDPNRYIWTITSVYNTAEHALRMRLTDPECIPGTVTIFRLPGGGKE